MIKYSTKEKENIKRGNVRVLKEVLEKAKEENTHKLTYDINGPHQLYQGYQQTLIELLELLN